ncbi:hypothetical protein F4801DRAFT_596596 [Xylaria longipes]|nr:hypothetical protein F4801DRAFT_596596 [Xylaria longipes]
MDSKSQQTLGIELEFIVFYTTPDKRAPAKDDERYGPALECPHYSEITPPPGFVPDENENWPWRLEAAWVRQKVADVIASAGFKSKASLHAKGSESDLYEFWNVVPDISVGLPLDFDQAYSPLKHAGVEVNSPVFVAGEDAFKEISTVVKAINSAFRRTVPPVCGFHVHVGRGNKPLELRAVQRTASLLWIAEDLIGMLHPGCRHGNRQCLGIRQFSNMTSCMETEQAISHPHGLGESQQAEFSMDRVDKDRKKPTNYRYNSPVDVTDSEEETLSRCFAWEYSLWFWDPWYKRLPAGLYMMDGVRSIFRTRDTAEIARFTSFRDGHRGAYNFANMESDPNVGKGPRKPTIEFRGAAGSLDSNWIVIWAKICLALCGPAAVESSDDDFFQLLYNCDEGCVSPDKYDVFDLLHDIGICKKDIDAVHRRIVSGRYEAEPGLAFHRETESCALDNGYGLGWQRAVRYDEFVPPADDDCCNDGSSKSIETDESSVNPIVDGLCGLGFQENDCLTGSQHLIECGPTLDGFGWVPVPDTPEIDLGMDAW